MKKHILFWQLILIPFLVFSQGAKKRLYTHLPGKQKTETDSVVILGAEGRNRLSFSYAVNGPDVYLAMSGTGWGTTTINNGDSLLLLLANDSVVTLKSTSLQSFAAGVYQNTYRHLYLISPTQLEILGKTDLAGIRKYSFGSYADLTIPRESTGKLKQLSTFFLTGFNKESAGGAAQRIDVKDIRNYIGDSITFCSKVYRTRYFGELADGSTLLDLQGDGADPEISVVILKKDRDKFNGAPEKKYLNKEVCISGVPMLRNNTPYVVIQDKAQVAVTSPVNLTEIELFAGDSVTVAGRVVSAYYFEESEAKQTMLYVRAPFQPEQALTLVIENEDRKNFDKPEADYLNKMVRVSGKVVIDKRMPQMLLRSRGQIEVLADTAQTSSQATAQANIAGQPVTAFSGRPAGDKKDDQKSEQMPFRNRQLTVE